MIYVKGITKSFGKLQVLKGIDLHINKGEVVSIVGPSGAGKTTLLQIIGTLDKPDTGSVFIDGVDVGKLSTNKLADFRNEHIGFVFQRGIYHGSTLAVHNPDSHRLCHEEG